MDDFVCGKLTEWGLEEYIPKFKGNKVNKDNFTYLQKDYIKELIPEIGPRSKFTECQRKFKEKLGRNKVDHTQPSTSATVRSSAKPSASATPTRGAPAGAGIQTVNPAFVRRLSIPSESPPLQCPTLHFGKRKLGGPRLGPSPEKRQKRHELDRKLQEVKGIMSCVSEKLPDDDSDELIAFLRELIENLEMDKKELVGVFGKTGTGKSSLINAVIGEENLLPTGDGRACTSVIIKVEANTESFYYVAKVEFISEEELEELLWSTKHLFGNSSSKKNKDDESKDSSEKMTALFGINWNNVSYDTFMKSEKYKKMSKAIKCDKILYCDSSSTLSQQLASFTQNIRNLTSAMINSDSSSPSYWPVVKCVTIKVPNCELLRHVTLVDLPGTGDRNKTRHDMWKEMVSSCGTVWIVTDMVRPESEKEPWEILRSACSLLGNGGECRNIHFICTKADQYPHKLSQENIRSLKENLSREFQELPEVENHFPDDCFKVFVVSARTKYIERNEIDDLEDFLQSSNDQRDHEQRYVPDAFGILALMKGARSQNIRQKMEVYKELSEKREDELIKIKSKTKPVLEKFERLLTEGVNTAKQQWETALDKTIGSENSYPRIKSILHNKGVQKTKTGDQINLNTTLSSFLTNSIDHQFKETFPNSGKEGLFYGTILDFSLDAELLIEENKDVELLLKFLKREEEKLKAKLCKIIRQRKKRIYNSLTDTVTKVMLEGYEEAEKLEGLGAVELMKQTLKDHLEANTSIFDKAKHEMLKQLDYLMGSITEVIYSHLEKAMDLSLNRNVTSVPDITKEFNDVKRFYMEEVFKH